jgi:FHA domain
MSDPPSAPDEFERLAFVPAPNFTIQGFPSPDGMSLFLFECVSKPSSSHISFHETGPTENWTVAEVITWRILQASHKNREEKNKALAASASARKDVLIEKLRQKTGAVVQAKLAALGIEEDGAELVEEEAESTNVPHRQAPPNDPHSMLGDENAGPNNGKRRAVVARPMKTDSTKNLNVHPKPATELQHSNVSTAHAEFHVEVVVLSGIHKGDIHRLFPVSTSATSAKSTCLVGRTKKNSVSFPKDDEVSTDHGKFILTTMTSGQGHCITKSLVFVDTNSTNGTWLFVEGKQNRKLTPNKEHEMKSGYKLHMGEHTSLQVNILY